MDSRIVLSAQNQQALDLLINDRLKQGYLLKGGVSQNDQGELEQVMVLPRNIDGQVSFKSFLPLLLVIALIACFEYFKN